MAKVQVFWDKEKGYLSVVDSKGRPLSEGDIGVTLVSEYDFKNEGKENHLFADVRFHAVLIDEPKKENGLTVSERAFLSGLQSKVGNSEIIRFLNREKQDILNY